LRRFARNVLREQDVFARQVDGVHGGLEGKRRKKGRRGERERGRMEMEGRGATMVVSVAFAVAASEAFTV
jgi:hypothetical protein